MENKNSMMHNESKVMTYKNKMEFFTVRQFSALSELIESGLPMWQTMELSEPRLVVFVGSGSSLNAARMSISYFREYTTMSTSCYDPNEYLRILAELPEHILIAISQTGRSLKTLQCLKQSKAMKHATIFVSATQNRKKQMLADIFIDLRCPDETIGPKTVGFTSTFIRLVQVCCMLAKQQKKVTEEDIQSIFNQMLTCINQMKELKETVESWVQQHQEWANLPYVTIAADGSLKPRIDEGALKLLETLRVPVLSYEIEEFSHGPHRLINKDSYHIFISDGETAELTKKITDYTRQYTEKVLYLSLKDSDIEIGIKTDKAGIELLYLLVFQVLANDLALLTGFNPDEKVHETFFKFIGTKD